MSSSALRVDQESGTETRLELVGTPRGLLYSWTITPRDPHASVFICSSVFGDFLANYHREKVLAKSLATLGISVTGFHYAGEGNSQGDRSDMTFNSLCNDAGAVLDHVRAGDIGLGFVGTRVGALVASRTGHLFPSAPLAMWQPVIDGHQFLAEAHRARRMSLLAGEGSGEASHEREGILKSGVLDLLGYDIHPAFVESIEDVKLGDLLGPASRSVLVAQFRGQEGAGDSLSAELVRRGLSVTSQQFDVSEAWWFDREAAPRSADLIPTTARWLQEHLVNERQVQQDGF